jgi:RimJ/RimL family protein N-acetyltransferase
MNIRTKRLLLRKWKLKDAERLFELASNPEVGPPAGWPPHKTVRFSREIIKNVLSEDEIYAIVSLETMKIIGCIGLKFGCDCCGDSERDTEFGYWLGKPYWGQGYMTEAINALLWHAFVNLDMQNVWIRYYEGNQRSKRITEKLNFKYVRTNPKGETLLGYTLPEAETCMTRIEWLHAIR